MPTAADLQSGIVIAAFFVGLLIAAELWRKFGNPPAEWTRKLVHFGGGLTCLAIPFFIRSHWVVLGLATCMAIIFVVSKRKGWLQSVHGVDRKSAGTEFYPVVVYLLFVLCFGTVWKFVICVLVLAVSDSAAALVGKRFGKLRFQVEEEFKSVEGSFAFFVVTFAVVFVPLLIWNPLAGSATSIWHYVLAASLIGLLVMCVELISLRGMDNLWVPLGTLLVLTKTMQTDVYDLSIQNVSFLAILLTVVVASQVSRAFNTGGAIVLCLASYSCWAMGSFDWALPIFMGFGLYLVISFVAKTPWQLKVRPVLYNSLPAFLLLATGNVMLNIDRPDGYQFMFIPFLAAVSISLTQACSNLMCWSHRKNPAKRILVTSALALLVTLVAIIPGVARDSLSAWPGLFVVTFVCLAFSLVSCKLLPPLPPGDAPKRWLYLRAGLALAGGGFVVVLQWSSICPIGTPL